MRQNREQLLRKLEAVAPGLAIKEAVEQSSCFVFRDGRVITFNDEIACSIGCDIGVTGAVAAKPLLALLGKLTEEDIDVSVDGTQLLVKGKGRRSGVALEANVVLPVESVDVPQEWQKLDPEFADAVAVVQQCAGKDANQFSLTCIHVHPDYLEACDNYQMARYPIETGVGRPFLVKRDNLKHVSGLGMTEISESNTWVHFRNPTGLVFSARRELDEFQSLDKILAMQGEPATLPGGLAEAVSRAEIFSAENGDNNVVIVELRKGELRLKGVGANGWYEERKSAKWDGERIAFNIAPKLLVDITTRANDCQIAPGRLKIDGGKFTYVTCLGKVEE